MVKYFTYHMKKTVIRFVVMALFLVMMANSFTVTSYSYMGIDNVNVSLSSFSVFAIVAPAIVAALEFSQFMNRRNLDTWYSLPISRRDLFIVHFAAPVIRQCFSLCILPFIIANEKAAAPKGVLGMRELRPGGLSPPRMPCLCAVHTVHLTGMSITPVLS